VAGAGAVGHRKEKNMSFSIKVNGTKRGVLHAFKTDPQYAPDKACYPAVEFARELLEKTHDKISFVDLEASGHHEEARAYKGTDGVDHLHAGHGNISIKLTWNGWQQFSGDPDEPAS
jgi:hypothetical protein